VEWFDKKDPNSLPSEINTYVNDIESGIGNKIGELI